MRVHVFAAGTHSHAVPGGQIPNSFGSESEELIQAMLEKAGYTKDLTWEVRIDKMLHCSTESRPIRIQGYKPYGVSMRVKPQPFSTADQLVTLLIPDGSGYSAKNLFEQLRAMEKSVSRQWRKELNKKTTVEQVVVVNEPPVMSVPNIEKVLPDNIDLPLVVARPTFKNLQGICKDHAKLKYALTAIYKLSKDDRISSKEQFLTAWRSECEFHKDNFPLRVCGRVIYELLRKDYIVELLSAGRIVGYALAPSGKEFLGMELSQTEKDEKVLRRKKESPVAPLDYTRLLIDSREKAQELADAGAKLEQNQKRKDDLRLQMAVLQRDIEAIDKEDEIIGKVLSQNKEAFDLLKRLLGYVTVLPIEQ